MKILKLIIFFFLFQIDYLRLLLTAAVAVWKPKVVSGYDPKKIAQ